MSDGNSRAFDHLADLARWVAWREELRNDVATKIPYAPSGKRAKANDPQTWGTRAAAANRARILLNGNSTIGGIGIVLGDLGGGILLGGVDLDSCLDGDELAPWVSPFLAACPTYTERSPSGTGLKMFFNCPQGAARVCLARLGVTDVAQWGVKRTICGLSTGGNHPPAAEVYFSHRYFTTTGDLWPGTSLTLAFLDEKTLEHLARVMPQAEATAPRGPASNGGTAQRRGRDTSRSGIALGKGAALRRQGCTFEEMVDALRRDPETADWVRGKGEANNQRELRRIWDRTGLGNGQHSGQRTIRVLAGLRHEAADAGLAAMHAAGIEFYQRDRNLVRACIVKAKTSDGQIISVPGIAPVTEAMLTRALGQSARWEKLTETLKVVRIDPPKAVVEQILGMVGEWPFPPLTGVIGTPTLRPDGTLLTAEGYDPATGLVLLAPPAMPAIPENPLKTDAKAALDLLRTLLEGFPFTDEASRAVALSMMMTPVLRGALAPAVPLHATTAPAAGTGKSYLADLASAIAAGERCAVVAVAPNPEETEKRLIGAVLAGYPIIGLDNCNGALAGDFLCQASERPVLQVRPLGTSNVVRMSNTVTIFANGNNLVITADLVRRTLVGGLDANMENPEERVFEADPVAAVLGDRGRYVAAVLTIARAYISAGMPERRPALPSYAAWSNLVRSPLLWLGCEDPVSTIASARAEDPLRQDRSAVFAAWAAELATDPASFTTSELIDAADERDPAGRRSRPIFYEALLTVARERRGIMIDPKRLGMWLSRTVNTIAAGHKLTVNRQDAKRPRWALVRPKQKGE
ncbi:MAG TPA: hypothetical protein VGF39_13995 [Stellaceae bacterium]